MSKVNFLFEENNNNNMNIEEIKEMIEKFENENENEENVCNYIDSTMYDYYDRYTTKYLMKICEYYDIDKEIKILKCKKSEIINIINYFESLPENISLVERRNELWCYMEELSCDNKMKKYIIWN